MSHRLVRILMVVMLAVATLSLITTNDRTNWILEECVVLIAIPFVWTYSSRVGLTSVLAVAATVQMLVITHGAHATYEHAWLGEQLAHLFGMHRNPWDRVGHLMQGVVPALAAREVLLRHARLNRGALVTFLAVSVAMCVSAIYEIIEMILSLIGSEATKAFVNTNGDIYDPQWDMTMALIGLLIATIGLARSKTAPYAGTQLHQPADSDGQSHSIARRMLSNPTPLLRCV